MILGNFGELIVPLSSTPPKHHANYERWSLVFFSRPAFDIELRALSDESPIIAEAVAKSSDPSKFNTGQTAQAWFMRRIKNQRINNRKVSFIRRVKPLFSFCVLLTLKTIRALRPGVPVAVLNTLMLRQLSKLTERDCNERYVGIVFTGAPVNRRRS